MKELKAVKVNDNHYQVDMRGWMCPYPKYAITAILEKLPSDSYLDLLVDCPAATKDVPDLAKRQGYEVQRVELLREGEWLIRITNLHPV
ncbi:sulfurtransferase TusA family protein [Moorella sulfitireducens]|uniref:sulfurtransferase TusA family protein n=1 Tax=Neomoorella sulfitireducens TaxID=2972948 RepID=UPI0021AC78E4|nr:sulfurtransferase TusA family protein [Moorella sulfitireducens]